MTPSIPYKLFCGLEPFVPDQERFRELFGDKMDVTYEILSQAGFHCRWAELFLDDIFWEEHEKHYWKLPDYARLDVTTAFALIKKDWDALFVEMYTQQYETYGDAKDMYRELCPWLYESEDAHG